MRRESVVEWEFLSQLMGARIWECRVNAHMTQEQLSLRSGVSRNQIQNIESGRSANPTVLSIYALAAALNVAVEEILPEPAKVPLLSHSAESGTTRSFNGW